jgi:hypothetical protein
MNAGQQALSEPMPMRPAMTGWNTRDDLDGMDPTDAITMDNWYADAGGLLTRKGSVPYATGLTGQCETIAEYFSGTSHKLIACSGGSIYDVTGGTVASLASGFGSNVWITTNFSGRLFMANGVDAVQAINGAAIASAAFTGPPSNPVGVVTFRGRLYFWLNNSPVFWYAPLGNVTGALASFDLSTIAQFGGNILTLTNFSHDGGDGVTNMFAIVMTTGEVILYLGNDPSTTATWNISGKYKLGAPINARSVAAYGGDVYLTTLDDHVALQEQLTALKVGQTPPRSKITGAVLAAITQNPGGYGFQAMYYGKGRRVIFNAPSIDTPGTYEQHVYNTSNQAWQRFVGMSALCWCEFQGNLFFGKSDGSVWQADTGDNDNGAAIVCNCQQAWNALNMPAGKQAVGVRPIVQALAGQPYVFNVGYDYQPLVMAISGLLTPGTAAIWDVAMWDVSQWTGEAVINPGIYAAAGTGTAVSFALQASAMSRLVWMRTDLVVQQSPII